MIQNIETKKYAINSITSGPRQSNFELLRIVAMILVLIVHADFGAIGIPTEDTFIYSPINAWIRTIFESSSIVCVNVFILISGWFGINPTLKGLFGFIFQCVYFYVGIYIIMCIIGVEYFSLNSLIINFSLIRSNWFVGSYIGLYLLAPLINSFLQYSNRHQIILFLLAFYSFQSVMGWIGPASFVNNGYSSFSFIGLYSLGRYIKQYRIPFERYAIIVYTICVIFISVCFWSVKIVLQIGVSFYAYINPLIIIASVYLFLYFSRINIARYNNCINWIAKSSFAVFLFHVNPYIAEPIYLPLCRFLYESQNGILCILAMGGGYIYDLYFGGTFRSTKNYTI